MRIAFALLSAILLLSACNEPEDILLLRCEAVLKQRLPDPRRYERAEVLSTSEHLSMEAWRVLMLAEIGQEHGEPALIRRAEWNLDQKIGERKSLKQSAPYLLTKFISYHAPNMYGTWKRSLAICTYLSDTASPNLVVDADVRINGLTGRLWMARQHKHNE